MKDFLGLFAFAAICFFLGMLVERHIERRERKREEEHRRRLAVASAILAKFEVGAHRAPVFPIRGRD